MKIIEGSEEWADRYRTFCQAVYQSSYPKPELGLPQELFSPALFSSPRVVEMFKNRCRPAKNQKSWLAVDDNGAIVGVVAAHRYPDYCEMQSFYVDPKYQGQGIGHQLYQMVLAYAGKQPLQVDVVYYMHDTIAMYKHWGFKIDRSRESFSYDIPEWPAAAREAYRAIYLVKSGAD